MLYNLSNEMPRRVLVATAVFDYCFHKRMPEMQIILDEIIDECSDIFAAAHILPVLNRNFILPI